MAKVIIVTDSSAYLPKEIVAAYPIEVLPLTLIWEGKEYRDGIDIQPDEFYLRLSNSENLPKTSQVTVHQYQEMFQRLLDEGYEVLNLGISKGISSSYDSAIQALKSFTGKPVEVLDTKLVSMALGFQVLAAARAAEAGANLATCKKVAEDAYPKIGVYFTVETLKFLAAGGRINSAKRLVGTALNIKPLLEIRDGKIELVESVRSRKKAIKRMVALVERDINGRKPVCISVFHALEHDVAQSLLAELKESMGAEEAILSHVSPVIGAHVGPGTISIAYMAG
ncbi:MAG: DegV family protein [Anaerolineaceae bacterium]|jgi:DegV family protein with EDD domain|nr:DegV family protein [Anaerolineaceae bacterium]